MTRETEITKGIARLFDVGEDAVRPLNHFLFLYEKDGKPYMARVLDEPSHEEQLAEVAWVNYLAEGGIGFARPVPSATGALVEKIEVEGGAYCVVSLEKVPGAPPTAQEWDRPLFRELGRTIGRMHRLTEDFHREHPGLKRADWHAAEIYNPDFIPERSVEARAQCAEIVAQVRALPRDGSTYGLIHGDIHQWNFHLVNGKPVFFDTDECEPHFFVHDLGVLINSAVEESFNGVAGGVNSYAEVFIGDLLEGYAEERTLAGEWIERLPLFIKLREVMSFIDAYLEWDMEDLSLQQRIILNRYQNAIENNVPVLHIDFRRFC